MEEQPVLQKSAAQPSQQVRWQLFWQWLWKRIISFRYAFQGLFFLFWTQGNAQIHAFAAVVAIAMGFFFRIERLEWLVLVLTITLVIAAEGANTAVEAVVDLASPERHPLAKIAKDVGAGTVLVTAFGALAVGLIMFLPRLWALVALWLGWGR